MKSQTWLTEFFFAKRELPGFAICRVAFGLALFLHYITIFPDRQVGFGPDGLWGNRLFSNVDHLAPIGRNGWSYFAGLQPLLSPAAVTALILMEIAAAACFAIGWKTRISGALALVIHAFFYSQNEFSYWGWGKMISYFTIYILLSPATATYSLDERRLLASKKMSWREISAKRLVPVWPLRLLQFHTCTFYYVTAWRRFYDLPWRNGSALLTMLTDNAFTRWHVHLREWRSGLRLLTYLTWAIELGAPIGLVLRRTSRYWAIALICVHLAIEFSATVGYWNYVMIPVLLNFVIRGQRTNLAECDQEKSRR